MLTPATVEETFESTYEMHALNGSLGGKMVPEIKSICQMTILKQGEHVLNQKTI